MRASEAGIDEEKHPKEIRSPRERTSFVQARKMRMRDIGEEDYFPLSCN